MNCWYYWIIDEENPGVCLSLGSYQTGSRTLSTVRKIKPQPLTQQVTNLSLLFSATNTRYVLMCSFIQFIPCFHKVSLLCTLGTLSEHLNNKPLVSPQSLWCLWSWLCLYQWGNYQLINCCGLIAQWTPCVNIWALCCSRGRKTGAGLVPCVINVCQACTTEALVRLWAAGIKGAFSHAWPSRPASSLCLWSGAKSTRLLL